MERGDIRNIIFSVVFFLLIGSIFAVTDRDVWFDESFSVLHSQQGAVDIIGPVDVHPPTYYLFLAGWIKLFGINSIVLRISSLLVGILAIIYFYKLFRRFYPDKKDNKIWLVIIVLFTLSTNIMYYFTEIRMYAWLMAFCIMSFYYMFMMCDVDFTKYRFKYMFSVIAFLLLHYYAIIYVGLQFLYLAARTRFKFIRKMWLQLGILAVFTCGYVAYFTIQKARTDIIFFQSSTWWSVLSTYYHYFFFYFEPAIPTLFTILGVPFIIMVLGLAFWAVDRKLDNILLFLIVIIPPFAGMLVNLVVAPVYHHRYFTMGAWAIFILLPMAWVKLIDKKREIIALIVIIFTMLMVGLNLVNYFVSQNNDIIKSFDTMKSIGCNSIILHESTMSLEPMLYYSQLNNCNFTEYIYQNLTVKQENAIGYDAIDRNFYKRDNMDGIDKFYFFEFMHLMDTSGFTCWNVLNMTGIKLLRCVSNV